jgi:Flp pilus assembly protein TadD
LSGLNLFLIFTAFSAGLAGGFLLRQQEPRQVYQFTEETARPLASVEITENRSKPVFADDSKLEKLRETRGRLPKDIYQTEQSEIQEHVYTPMQKTAQENPEVAKTQNTEESPVLRRERLSFLIMKGRTDEAVLMCDSPELAEQAVLQAVKKGAAEKAVKFYEKLGHKEHAGLLSAAGMAYEASGDNTLADSLYLRAFFIDSSNPLIINNYARTKDRAGEYAEAAKLYELCAKNAQEPLKKTAIKRAQILKAYAR